MVKIRLVEMERDVQDDILNLLFIYHQNDPIEVCDPFYTEPVETPYVDELSREECDAMIEECNNFYKEEIKQDTLRYQLYLDMLAVKKEMEENPLIFDKEEEYYETDPHKLVDFDETFTPFFDKESNDVFFHNLKNPLRLKWEEIPEEQRKLKIVHLDQAIRKLQYDEVEYYFNRYLINKDLVLLFLKFMPNIWPISTFLSPFENYLKNMTGKQMYEFFIERVVLLGSSYTPNEEVVPITDQEKEVVKYMKEVYRIKDRMFNDLLACIRVRPIRLLFKAQETEEEILKKSDHLVVPNAEIESDILTRFIQKYKLYVPHSNPDVVWVYNYPLISKLIIILNLSFFNIFPISTREYEEIRESNRLLYIYFLWYLKDFFWEGHNNTLQIKNDIKSYFSDEAEYLNYSRLIEYYPSRMVQAKEFFYSYHNKILREVAVDYLEDYFEKKEAIDKILDRHNADFYILNREFQSYDKLKQKIYSKSRKLQRTPEETEAALNTAFEYHRKHQRYLAKVLFRAATRVEGGGPVIPEKKVYKKKKVEKREYIDFFVDETQNEVITRSYEELVEETKKLFIEILKYLKIYEEVCAEHAENVPKIYDDPKLSIYDKLLKKRLQEPNLWNKFDDYCYMAIDKYPTKMTYLEELYKYQKDFVEEFLRDIMFFWGKGKYVPPEINPILTNRRRKTRVK